MRLSSFIISMFVFAMVVMGMFTSFNQIFAYYNFGQYSNPEVEKLLKQINSTQSQIESKVKNIKSSTGIVAILDTLSFIFVDTINVLKDGISMVFVLFSNLNSILAQTLSIPSWFTAWLLGIAIASIAFLIIKALVKWEI